MQTVIAYPAPLRHGAVGLAIIPRAAAPPPARGGRGGPAEAGAAALRAGTPVEGRFIESAHKKGIACLALNRSRAGWAWYGWLQ